VVDADSRDSAVELATELFVAAAARAGLPAWSVARADAISEAEDDEVEYAEAEYAEAPDRSSADQVS
jgi:hypothetical protein